MMYLVNDWHSCPQTKKIFLLCTTAEASSTLKITMKLVVLIYKFVCSISLF